MSTAMPASPSRNHPLRVGTRGSPLALIQTRGFIQLLARAIPASLEEHVIRTTGDAVQDRRLAEIGGKGLFAKEIHEALADGRIDLAVHSLKDLETELPPGIVLGCTLRREDARDALILAPGARPDPDRPFDSLPAGALIGTASVRRQAQLLHVRPDLAITMLRGNVQTRLEKLAAGVCTASLLAYAGLRRLGLADRASVDLRLASTGEEMLEVLEKEELPSLILMDWNLPGLTGVDLLRKIKSNEFTRAIPVIVFTTSLSPERVVEIYNERANCIVEKPIGFDAFTDLALKIEEFWLQTSILPLHLGREASARV